MPTPKPSKELARIQRSLEQMKPRREDAAKFFRAYCGDYSIKGRRSLDDIKDEVYLNFVFSYVENNIPKIFSGDPRIAVDSKNRDSDLSAPNMMETINYWFRELGAKDTFERCLFDWFFGYAAIGTDWEYEETTQEVDVPDPVSGLLTKQTHIKVLKDQPRIRWISPWNVIRDPDSEISAYDRIRGERMLLTMRQLEEMDGINPVVLEKVKPAQIPMDLTKLPFKNEPKIGTENEWVVVYKIWDIENEECRLLYEGQDVKDYLYVKPWPYDFEVGNDRFPITLLEGKPSTENNYTMAEFRAFWTQVMERNRVRTTLQSHARRIHPGWLNKKGSGNTEKELENFANSKIGEVATVTNPEGIIAKPHPEIPLDLYKYDSMARDDLQNTAASLDSQNETIANTATEASLQAASGNVRSIRKRQQFESFVATVGAKVGGLCQQFMDKAIAVKIKNPTNPRELSWLELSKEQIQGEFNYLVKPGVMQHRDEGLHRQQVLKFAELMSNNPYVRQDVLAREIAKANEIDPDELLKTQAEVDQENAQKQPEKPPLRFKDIDPAALPPQDQHVIVDAALKQNGVMPPAGPMGASSPPPMDGMGQAGGAAPGLPGLEPNQAPPPMEGAMMPPANPVLPISEGQGGPT